MQISFHYLFCAFSRRNDCCIQLPSVELRLRKHTSAVSKVHRRTQMDATLEIQTQYIKNVVERHSKLSNSNAQMDKVGKNVVSAMIKPETSLDLLTLQQAFILLQHFEQAFRTLNKVMFSENDLKLVSEDANKRLGEIVLRAMGLEGCPSSTTVELWRRWIRRNPINMLKKLLIDNGQT